MRSLIDRLQARTAKTIHRHTAGLDRQTGHQRDTACDTKPLFALLLGVAEKRFRKLRAPHQMKDVFEGRKFEDGKPVSTDQRKEAA